MENRQGIDCVMLGWIVKLGIGFHWFQIYTVVVKHGFYR